MMASFHCLSTNANNKIEGLKNCAFKKDPNKGFDVSNIAWDTLANHNKDRLTRARAIKADHELINKQSEEEELYEELINDD